MQDIPPDPTGNYEREYWIMSEMGWSWPELMVTPHLVVEEIAVRLSAKNKWTAKKDEIDKQMRGKK